MSEHESGREGIAGNFADMIPEPAKQVFDDAMKWVKSHPTEAALIGAGAGFVLGLTGASRIYRGVNAVRSMPFVSQLVMGLVAKGMMPKDGADSIH